MSFVGREAIVALVAAAAMALPGAASAADHPGGEWTPLGDTGSDTNIDNTNELGLIRAADGRLHVLWVNGRDDGSQAVVHSDFRKGEPSHPGGPTKSETVMTVNPAADQTLNDRVDLIGTSGGGLQALFSTTFPGSPIDGILATSVSADGGATWSTPAPASGTASGQRSPVYAAEGIGGAVTLEGVPIGAWGDSSPDGGGFRVGLTTNGSDSRFSPGCCEIDPDVGVDSVNGETYIGANLQDVGIHVTSPVGGDFGTVPQSSAAWTQQRTAITGRIGAPGVYVGYGTGGNMFDARPAIYRVGEDRFIFLKNQHDAAHVGIAPAPGGRLWIYWDRDEKVYASRTNPEVTKFGAIVRYPAPGGAPSIHRLAGEGSLGSLDLFALVETSGNGLDWWTERLMPGLTLEVAGDAKKVEAGEKVKLKVTDAGDPVRGIDVYIVIGKKKIADASNASGVAKIKVPKDTKGGKEQAFTDAYPDYTDGDVQFKVKG